MMNFVIFFLFSLVSFCYSSSYLNERLIIAVQVRGIEEVKKLALQDGLDVNAHGYSGSSVLNMAVYCGKLEVAQFLIKMGANIDGASRYHIPLYTAVSRRNAEMINLLCDNGANINGCTLGVAAEMANTEILELLLKRGVEIDATNDEGQTALVYAAGHKYDPRLLVNIKFLIDHGANVNIADNKGRSALMYAVEMGSFDIIQVLLERGADVNAADLDGVTALMIAAKIRNVTMLKFLYELGADVDAIDKEGKTVLMRTAPVNHAKYICDETDGHLMVSYEDVEGVDVVKFLLQVDANINIKDKYGRTAEDYANDQIKKMLSVHQLENLWIMWGNEYENCLQWLPHEIKDNLIEQVMLPK